MDNTEIAEIPDIHVTDPAVGRLAVAALAQLRALEPARLESRGRPGASHPPERLKEPRIGNLVGLFGPRGAGKSTVLARGFGVLRGALGDQTNTEQRFLFVKGSIDLSLCPKGQPIGLVILQWLRKRLAGAADPHSTPCRFGAAERASDKMANDAFRELAAAYICATPDAVQVIGSLASSEERYRGMRVTDLGRRLELPGLIATWLEAEAQRAGVAGFVAGLDDVDLLPEGGVEELMGSLVDELHQARLVLILAGDETRVLQAPSKLPPDQVHELWYKVLRPDLRIRLAPWTKQRAWGFKPIGERSTLKEELNRFAPEHPPTAAAQNAKALITELLPHWPRPLENLHRALKRHVGESPNDQPTIIQLLRSVLESLGLTNIDPGESALKDAVLRLIESEWTPSSARIQGRQTTETKSAFRDVRYGELPSARVVGMPSAHPAAHTVVIALLDHALECGWISSWDLLNRWPSARRTMDRACVQRAVPLERAQHYLTRRGAKEQDSFWAECHWLELGLRERDTIPIAAGPRAALQAVDGHRSAWPSTTFASLSLPDRQRRSDATMTRLPVPATMRDLAIFLDRLGAAPWETLSYAPRLVDPGLVARVAAAFTLLSFFRPGFEEIPAGLTKRLFGKTMLGLRPDPGVLLEANQDDLYADFDELVIAAQKATRYGHPQAAEFAKHPIVAGLCTTR